MGGLSAVLKEKMFAEGQKLFEMRQKEASILAEISGAQRVARNANQRIKQAKRSTRGEGRGGEVGGGQGG